MSEIAQVSGLEMWLEFLGGNFIALLGAAIAFFVAALGSTKGVGIAGQAGAGVLTEDPNKFVPVMVLEALASTQAIYGFVIAFLIMGKVSETLVIQDALTLLLAGLPIGIIGYLSGIYQGKVATAGIHMVAKRPEGLVKAIVLAVVVEMFAIFAFLVSILMIGLVK